MQAISWYHNYFKYLSSSKNLQAMDKKVKFHNYNIIITKSAFQVYLKAFSIIFKGHPLGETVRIHFW